MNMMDLSILRAQLVVVIVIMATSVAGCANPAIEDARRLAGLGQHEAALQKLDEAAKKDHTDQ